MIHHAHGNRLTPEGAMNFAPRLETDVGREINRLIDAALEDRVSSEPPRVYLGGSRLGVECLRQLAYEWHKQKASRAAYDKAAAVAGGRPVQYRVDHKFPGKVIRRFQMGHMHEDETAGWIRAAGFDLRTHKQDGRQFGFTALKGLIGGHFDGVILGGPLTLKYPGLWEHKIMASKKWRETVDKGVEKTNKVYYAQLQVYMAYSPKAVGEQLDWALFTALNTDTSELHFEVVPFDPEHAQWASDRGVQVVQSRSPEEFPRITSDPNFWQCKWCDHADSCWSMPTSDAGAVPPPSWLGGGA